MQTDVISALLETADLKILKFNSHNRVEMNYRNRTLQDFYMMTYIRKGTAKLKVQDRVYTLNPGTVYGGRRHRKVNMD